VPIRKTNTPMVRTISNAAAAAATVSAANLENLSVLVQAASAAVREEEEEIMYHVGAFVAVAATIFISQTRRGKRSAGNNDLSAALTMFLDNWVIQARIRDTTARIYSLQDQQRTYRLLKFRATNPEEIVFLQEALDGMAAELAEKQTERRRLLERGEIRNIRRRLF
jgi:hypothetical protein